MNTMQKCTRACDLVIGSRFVYGFNGIAEGDVRGTGMEADRARTQAS